VIREAIKFKTPSVPAWITRLQHPQYRNIYSFNLGNPNLWGTETLLGDWDGEYLLVAQDFYPASYVADLIRLGDPYPYRHKDGIPTNANLQKTLRYFGRLGESVQNTECNFLYVSACFLLRDDGLIRSTNLPDQENVLRISLPVLSFTIGAMSNLKYVVAMGNAAQKAISAGGLKVEIQNRKLRYFAVKHPAAALSDADRFKEWEPVFTEP
jgi:hypothetical protein